MTTPGCTGYGCRSQRMIDFINVFEEEHGAPPTVREIAEGLGYSAHSHVVATLNRMEEEGRVERAGMHTARSIRVKNQPIKPPRDRRNEL